MIFSKENLFSDDQDLAQSAGAYASTNYKDWGLQGTPVRGNQLTMDHAHGCGMPIEAIVTETFTSGGAATLTIAIQVDSDSAFGSATTVYTTGAIALADLVEGYNLPIMWLPEGITEQYMRLLYTVGTAATTAGKITAGISAGRQTNR